MRILSLSTVYPAPQAPGRGPFIRLRLQHLAAHAEIKVVAPLWAFDQGGDRRDGALEVLHPKWLYLPGTGILSALLLFAQMLPRIRRIRRAFPFQIIDAHFGYPDGIAAALVAAVMRVPFAVTLRGSELLHARYSLRRLCMGWAFRRAARVIAVSEELRQLAISLGADPVRTRCIPNGVDGNCFFPRSAWDARRKYGMPLDKKIVLTAGHLIELKGHRRVAAALRLLRDDDVPVQLWIAGGSPGRGVRSYESEIRAVISDLRLEQDVHFLGQLQPGDFAEVMSAADVFCLASSREGCPNVVQEALSCGVPVVATKVGAVPDMIASEDHGILVSPGDIPALAAALKTALARQWNRQEISLRARARSWERVAAEVVEELHHLAQADPLSANG